VEAKGKVAAAQRASSAASFQIFCESLMTQWAHGGKMGAQDNRYVRQLELVCSSVNRQTYVTVYSSVLVPRKIYELYSSVPRNLKKLRKISCFPVVN
jgi:hypothetical protein